MRFKLLGMNNNLGLLIHKFDSINRYHKAVSTVVINQNKSEKKLYYFLSSQIKVRNANYGKAPKATSVLYDDVN
jgi:hypothetical protein